ncbi:MAG: GNAT family N-acetyltransferase [Anaerolineae bacterium]|nr:GNAT family N-acetyltransferase [Anaerolineae bacterium]
MTNSFDYAPQIPGLKFRTFNGEADYPQIARVLTASGMADKVERQVSAKDIAKAFQHLSNCNPQRDLLIGEVDGAMVGYTRGWWEEGENGVRVYAQNGFLVPEWRRKGIGTALLREMENRLREVASAHPAELEKVFQVNVSQHQTGTKVMLEHAGYEPVRHFYSMVRPSLENIIEYPLPEGLEVRMAEPDHYRAIWKAIAETSRDEWGHHELTEQDYQDWLLGELFQPELWQVAWDVVTGEVAGTVLTYIHHQENQQFKRLRGYTEGIGVIRPWRRRGLARALISLSLKAQREAGMTESALVADTDSTSNVVTLYESCGFQVAKKDTLFRKKL